MKKELLNVIKIVARYLISCCVLEVIVGFYLH